MSRRRGAQEYARQSCPKTQTVLQNKLSAISHQLSAPGAAGERRDECHAEH